jgi:pimeloyl-ACP methyl ester carboxylesterase
MFQPTVKIEEGQFHVLRAGQPFGIDEYSICEQPNDELMFAGHVALDIPGGLRQQLTLTTDQRYYPHKLRVHSNIQDRSSDATVTFWGERATFETITENKHSTKTLTVKEDSVVLWNNVFHHFIPLLRRYDFARNGAQEFPLFPIGRVILDLKVSYSIVIDNQPKEIKHIFINVNDSQGVNIYMLDNQIVRIEIPSQTIVAALNNSAKEVLEFFARSISGPIVTQLSLNVKSEQVNFSSGDIQIAGTLTIPLDVKARLPAALLITGSGRLDRNGNASEPDGFQFGIYKAIAEWLSSSGLAVLRYDKRGTGQSSGDFDTSGISELKEDAIAALGFLRSHTLLDSSRICLIGHSEGGIIASLVAETDSRLKAIALLATPSDSLDVILFRQFSSLLPMGTDGKERERLLAIRLRSLDILKNTKNWSHPEVEDEFKSLPSSRRKWFEEHFSTNPRDIVGNLKLPIGIFHGEADHQVVASSAYTLAGVLNNTGRKDYFIKLFPSLDHLFMRSHGHGISEYAEKSRTIDVDFLRSLTAWIEATFDK